VNQVPSVVFSTTNQVTLHFTTDGSVTYVGFDIDFMAIDPANATVVEQSGKQTKLNL